MEEIDFRTERFFTELVTFGASGTFLVGLLAFALSIPVFGSFLIFMTVMIWTTHWRLHLNLETCEYHEYVWFFGLKFGEQEKFTTIQYIYIKQNKVREGFMTYPDRILTNVLRREVYDAYLKFSEADKIRVLRTNGKKELLIKLRPIVSFLKTKVIDYSDGDAREIIFRKISN